MSLNTAHTSNGVLMHANEYILLYIQKVSIKFFAPRNKTFEGIKNGCIYMTSHRLIFNNYRVGDLLQSFSAPYMALHNVDVMQPISGPSYIACSLKAQPNGNFMGEVKLKISLQLGDIYTFVEALKRACKLTKENVKLIDQSHKYTMKPYIPGDGWTEASFDAFKRPTGYYEWLPEQRGFCEKPLNFVYITQDSPPFPGIGAPPRYEPEHLPEPIPTNTPCAHYGYISQAPTALEFTQNIVQRRTCILERNVPCKNLCSHHKQVEVCMYCMDPNIWEENVPSESIISEF